MPVIWMRLAHALGVRAPTARVRRVRDRSPPLAAGSDLLNGRVRRRRAAGAHVSLVRRAYPAHPADFRGFTQRWPPGAWRAGRGRERGAARMFGRLGMRRRRRSLRRRSLWRGGRLRTGAVARSGSRDFAHWTRYVAAVATILIPSLADSPLWLRCCRLLSRWAREVALWASDGREAAAGAQSGGSGALGRAHGGKESREVNGRAR